MEEHSKKTESPKETLGRKEPKQYKKSDKLSGTEVRRSKALANSIKRELLPPNSDKSNKLAKAFEKIKEPLRLEELYEALDAYPLNDEGIKKVAISLDKQSVGTVVNRIVQNKRMLDEAQMYLDDISDSKKADSIFQDVYAAVESFKELSCRLFTHPKEPKVVLRVREYPEHNDRKSPTLYTWNISTEYHVPYVEPLLSKEKFIKEISEAGVIIDPEIDMISLQTDILTAAKNGNRAKCYRLFATHMYGLKEGDYDEGGDWSAEEEDKIASSSDEELWKFLTYQFAARVYQDNRKVIKEHIEQNNAERDQIYDEAEF